MEKRKGDNYSLRKTTGHIGCQWAENTIMGIGTSIVFMTKDM